MFMEREIVNRVANSKLISFDLEDYYSPYERITIDMKDWLFQEMIIREKDFREKVKNHDWSLYENKNVAIGCSADAIVPVWAYMLMTTHLEPFANIVVMGSAQDLEKALFTHALSTIDPNEFTDSKVVIKGCSKLPVPEYAYVEITRLLKPHVASIMYGEPCSTVPIYKARKK